MEKKPIRVRLIAMEAQTRDLLEIFFQVHGKGKFQLTLSQPDLYIADADSKNRSNELQQFLAAHPQCHFLLMSNREDVVSGNDNPKISLLKKPLKLKSLQEKLEIFMSDGAKNSLIKEQNASNTAANNEQQKSERDIEKKPVIKKLAVKKPIKSPPLTPDLVFKENKYLYFHIKTALEQSLLEKQKVIIQLGNVSAISINPKDSSITTTISTKRLKTIARIPLKSSMISSRFYSKQEKPIKGKSTQATEILWNCALWAAKGKLPDGTNLDKKVVLKHWPNLTQYQEIKHAAEIASLWIKEPTSLTEMIQNTHIPTIHINNFYSASKAAGFLIEASKNNPLKTKKQPKKQTETKIKPGLFSRILSHLKKS